MGCLSFSNTKRYFSYSTTQCENQLTGHLCNCTDSPNFKITNSNYMYTSVNSTIIDLNHQKIKGNEYSGKLLEGLFGQHSFPSDNSAIKFIIAIITDFQQMVILLKYTSLKTLIAKLNLTECDQLILINSIMEMNLTKYAKLKISASEIAKQLTSKDIKL